MSRHFKMTWEKSKLRWRKMYRGKVYVISPTTLGCEPTKEQSYLAANAWWDAKLAEIRGQPDARFDHIVRVLENLKQDSPYQAGYDAVIDYVRRSAKDQAVPEAEMMEIVPPNESMLAWGEVLSRAKKPTPADRTVKHWVARFLALRKDEVIGKELSVAQYDLIRICLDKFQEWIGVDANIEKINPERWVEWYRHLLNLDISVEYKKKQLASARNFISVADRTGADPRVRLASRQTVQVRQRQAGSQAGRPREDQGGGARYALRGRATVWSQSGRGVGCVSGAYREPR